MAAADRHRPPYPPAAIAALVGLLAPGVPARVLDAGCGTGHVAIPLARMVAQAVCRGWIVDTLEPDQGYHTGERGAGSRTDCSALSAPLVPPARILAS